MITSRYDGDGLRTQQGKGVVGGGAAYAASYVHILPAPGRWCWKSG